MKGFSAGIPIAILAALGQVQAQAQVHSGSAFEHHIEAGLEDVFDRPPHPHGGPHGDPHGGPHGGPGPASHPPMAHAARAFRPGEDAPSIESDPFFSGGSNKKPADHGPSAVPTCSTRTEHVVHTITKTVTPEHEHKHTPTSHPIGLDPAAHAPQSSSSHAPATTPAVAHVAQASSTAHAAHTSSTVHVANAPHTSSAAHIANVPHTSSDVHVANVPHTSSAAHIANAPHTSSAHSALIPASTQAPTSTSAAHVPVTTSTSTVHGPMTYNVIPVHVPSSHSSIKLHASSSSSAYPSGADGTRFHGTYGTPGAGVSFTGAGAQLAPNTGIVTVVCGLLGVLAYAL